MLESIEEQAKVCVARGCGFAALAVLTLMVGLSWDPALAAEVGGLLVLAACGILLLKGRRALERPVQRTELWMALDTELRPSNAVAQQVIGRVLHSCYLRFALRAAGLSATLLALSLGLRLSGWAPVLLAAFDAN